MIKMKTFQFNITKDADITFAPTVIKITPLEKTATGRKFQIELLQEFTNGFRQQSKIEEIPDALNIHECFEGGYDLDTEEPIINLVKLQTILDNFGINLQ